MFALSQLLRKYRMVWNMLESGQTPSSSKFNNNRW